MNTTTAVARGSVTLGKNALEILGTTTYSGNSLVILARELLQNSIDTCRERMSLEPDYKPLVSIKIEHMLPSRQARITCTDNGMGMSVEDILTRYLVIGAGSKIGKDTTGKFGFAKMATIINPEWIVLTNGHTFSHDTTDDDGTINIMSAITPIEGTIVNVLCRDLVGKDDVKRALQMIYFSDTHGIPVRVNLLEEHEDEDIPTLGLEDTWLGLDNYVASHNISTTKDDEAPQNMTATIMGALPEIGLEKNLTGINVVRLNGLVQFFRSDSSDRLTNIILDVEVAPDVFPTAKEYPFSLSRENMRGGHYWSVDSIFRRHDINSFTSAAMLVKEPERDAINANVNGKEISGNRGKSSYYQYEDDLLSRIESLLENDGLGSSVSPDTLTERYDEEEHDVWSHLNDDTDVFNLSYFLTDDYDIDKWQHNIDSRLKYSEDARVIVMPQDIERLGDEVVADLVSQVISSGGKPVIYTDSYETDEHMDIIAKAAESAEIPFDFPVKFSDYEKPLFKADIKRHAKIIALWRIAVQIVASERSITIGVFTSSTDEARYSRNGYSSATYSINPGKLAEQHRKLNGNIFFMCLWHTACHEAAHAVHTSHDERFVSKMDSIYRETANAFYHAMRSLKL